MNDLLDKMDYIVENQEINKELKKTKFGIDIINFFKGFSAIGLFFVTLPTTLF
jgi:hypothetical protein